MWWLKACLRKQINLLFFVLMLHSVTCKFLLLMLIHSIFSKLFSNNLLIFLVKKHLLIKLHPQLVYVIPRVLIKESVFKISLCNRRWKPCYKLYFQSKSWHLFSYIRIIPYTINCRVKYHLNYFQTIVMPYKSLPLQFLMNEE